MVGTFLLYVQSSSDDLWKEGVEPMSPYLQKRKLAEDRADELVHVLGGLEEVVRVLGEQPRRGCFP